MKDPNEPKAPKNQKEARAQEIDRLMRKAASRPAKYPDDAKAQAKKKKPKSYAKGGAVRGCGIARKGVRKARMR